MSIILTYFLYQIVENCMISQSLDYLVKNPETLLCLLSATKLAHVI